MLWRYIFGHCLLAIAVALLALLAVFMFIEVTDALGDIGRGSYTLADALAYSASKAPRLAVELAPVAAVVGALAGLGGLGGRHELGAMQSAGMSRFAITASAGFAALVVGLAGALVLEGVAPRVEGPAAERRSAAFRDGAAVGTQARWVREGELFARLGVPREAGDERLLDLALFEFGAGEQLRSATLAATARHEAAGAWRLEGVRTTTLEHGARGVLSARVDTRERSTWQAAVTPDVVAILSREPERLRLGELSRFIDYRAGNSLDAEPYRLAHARRLVYPFTVVAMVLVAVPLVLRSARTGRLATRVAMGVALGVTFHGLNEIAALAGLVAGVPALVAASAMTALVGLVGVGLLVHTRG